jgi:hypothetical protein
VGARSLGQARPRLGLESWPLAAVKLAVFFKGWNLGGGGGIVRL